ncbi:MAG: retropepsin-like aspartic protease [Candidatus Acidoferrales bacterium]
MSCLRTALVKLSPLFPVACALLALPHGLQAQEPLQVASLEYRPPILVVEVRVNGSEPLPFAFDTGTTTCLLDTQVARRLGIQPVQRPGRSGPGFARARTLAVGRAVARDLELVIRDLTPLSDQVSVKLAGILGFTWMEHFVFEIDYRAGRLTLWPRAIELTATAEQLPLPLTLHSPPNLSGASIYVPARLEGRHRCLMMIDTGTSQAILGRQIAARLGITVQPIRRAEEGGGLPTPTIGRFELAGRLFTNVTVVFDPRRGAGPDPFDQCVLGNQQLSEFVVTIDIPRRRVFFRALPPLPAQK